MALPATELEALTLDYWDKGTWDQYFLGNVLMYRLLKKGKTYTGGKLIRETLMYGQPVGGAFNAQSQFDTTKRDEHTSAFFKQAYYYEPVTWDIDDETQNSGPEAIVDLVDSKLNAAQKKIRQQMGIDLYGNSTYGGTGRGILGLPAMISQSTTAYGQISNTDLPEWTAGAALNVAGPLTFSVVRTLRTACVVGDDPSDEPTIFVTTRELLDVLRGLTLPQLRYEHAELADIGFKNIDFEGTPVVGTSSARAGTFSH